MAIAIFAVSWVVVMGVHAQMASGPQTERVTRMINEVMGPLLRDPDYRRALMTDPRVRAAQSQEELDRAAQAVGAELTAKGMTRVSAAQLREWHRLRGLMSRAEPSLCAGLWSGGASPQALLRALNTLSDADLRSWLVVSVEASRRQVQASTPLMDPPDLSRYMERALAALPPEERRRVQQALREAAPSPEQQCMLYRMVHRFGDGLRGAEQERFLRALAAAAAAEI